MRKFTTLAILSFILLSYTTANDFWTMTQEQAIEQLRNPPKASSLWNPDPIPTTTLAQFPDRPISPINPEPISTRKYEQLNNDLSWIGKEAISIIGYLLSLGAIFLIGNAIKKNNKKHYEAGKADAYLEMDRFSPANKRRR